MITQENEEFTDFWRGYLFGLAFTASGDDGEAPEEWCNPGGCITEVVDPDEVEEILSGLGKLDECKAECLDFLNQAATLIPSERMEEAGSDFHFNRNGHGCGFWDGDWPENGDTLDELCNPYGTSEFSWWINEDGGTEFDLHG